ncbi:MAG: dUTP diphosphatase [Oscillospiraceae bacterium]|jgi:dUTP pyrophosphatase|nr:dUTP diphosphatase [Oscillospiraceae bacterium]
MDKLKVMRVRPGACLPARATQGSAGYDLAACLDAAAVIPAGGRLMIPTGIAIAIGDPGVVALIFGRSGLGVKSGIVPANAVGVVDSDYRGELMVGLANHSDMDYTVRHGDRIAQMVLTPVLTPELVECGDLSETARGASGFGSSGR